MEKHHDLDMQMIASLATVPPGMQSVNPTIEDVDKLAQDPDLRGTRPNVQGITADVHHITKTADAWVTRGRKPPTLAQKTFGIAADLAPKRVWHL
jgi:hypothetical protein